MTNMSLIFIKIFKYYKLNITCISVAFSLQRSQKASFISIYSNSYPGGMSFIQG